VSHAQTGYTANVGTVSTRCDSPRRPIEAPAEPGVGQGGGGAEGVSEGLKTAAPARANKIVNTSTSMTTVPAPGHVVTDGIPAPPDRSVFVAGRRPHEQGHSRREHVQDGSEHAHQESQ
jgi:hypothetical protein